ncbi:polysaccharide biosynthesis tyrosine autokinase [candidate division KSB1 bacterium]|nr:polysaccharide biosynthesis tyrosine autokinase [candidate division KSB1 bacterium]
MEDFFSEQTQQTESFDIKRYLFGILKRWWLVLVITLVVTIPWIIHLKGQPPVYLAEVWVSFDNMTGDVPASLLESRRRKLQSRTFAATVSAKLGLCIQDLKWDNTTIFDRDRIFSAFYSRETPEPIPGYYNINVYPNGYCAIYHDAVRLDTVRTISAVLDTIHLNGLSFSLTPEINKQHGTISFYIQGLESSVKSLIARENVIFDQTGSLMRVTLKDANPNMASETLNMLTEIFLSEILEMQRENESYNRKSIEDKLILAEKELTRSDYLLKSFRNNHLRGINQETQDIVERLNRIEPQTRQINNNKNELELLLSRLDPEVSDFNDGVSAHYIYREIASLGIFEQSSAMTIARQELDDLDRNRANLLGRLPEHNNAVREVTEDITILEMTISQIATEKVREMEKDISELEENAERLQKELKLLPEEEMKLTQLSRQRRANEEIHQLYLRYHKEAELAEAVAPSNVSIIDDAIPPSAPITGDKKRKALIGLFIGFMLGISSAFLWEMADKSIRTREDINRYLKLPILGSIPKVRFDTYEVQDSEKAKSVSSQIVTHDYSPTPVGEAYRVLRTNLLFSKQTDAIRSIVVGSMSPGEGKSFTSTNLAIALAQQKSNTLLIDADLRRGVLHNTFNCPKKPGLTNYLTGVAPLSSVLNETYIPNLSLITCGSMIPNPSEILGSLRMQKFIEGITKRFDFVIFDTPPLNAATDAVVLGTLVDGVAIVVRSGISNGDVVRRRLEMFQNVQAKIVGVILNGAGAEVAHEGYSYYRY